MGSSPFVAPGEEAMQHDEAAERTRKIAQAKAFLQQQLADGPHPATEILLAAQTMGIAEGTLYTAKRRMRVQSRRQGYEDGHWLWALPIKRRRKAQVLQPVGAEGMS